MPASDYDQSPRVFIVEDQPAHAALAKHLLNEAGFSDVQTASSVRAGIERARKLLNVANPRRPTLVLLDWMLPDKRSPSLEGIVIAAEMVRAMDCGELHPAHLAVLSYSPSDDREQDALAVGCSLVLHKPLDLAKARQLRQLVETPPPFPRTPAQRAIYERFLRYTNPTMELLYAGQPSTALVRWSVKSVGWLVKASILQDLPDPLLAAWVQERGGLQRVRAFLRELPIAERELARLRELFFEEPGEDATFYARAIGWSKSGYYNLRERLFAHFAEQLNGGALDPEGEGA